MSYLEISDVSRAYGPIAALREFSLTAESGRILALVGPDGAGKTTLIRILCGLIRADRGSVRIDGKDAGGDFASIKPMLGYMPQVFSLYQDLSVEENLRFFAGVYGCVGKEFEQRRDYLYEFSRLAPFAKRRAGALSGGMKQKLALSCALMHQPRLLVLDEPTTGVDPLSRRQFWDILLEFRRQDVTTVVATPYMDEVARADRACLIYGGRKLADGTPRELTALFEGRVYYSDASLSADSIDRLNEVAGLQVRRFGSGLHLYTAPGSSVHEFRDILAASGIRPETLSPIEPGLEDCFIQLMERQT